MSYRCPTCGAVVGCFDQIIFNPAHLTTPQPSADAVRELLAEWKVRPGVTDAYKICANELESLLSGGSHA